jgi:hypothetical protein
MSKAPPIPVWLPGVPEEWAREMYVMPRFREVSSHTWHEFPILKSGPERDCGLVTADPHGRPLVHGGLYQDYVRRIVC